jgi:predicted ABC-class ATPase
MGTDGILNAESTTRAKTMAEIPQSMDALSARLRELDGRPFKAYQELLNQSYRHPGFRVEFVHIQGSPGAFPASVGHLTMDASELGLHSDCLSTDARRLATADYLLRAFQRSVVAHTRRNRGARGSGSYQPQHLPPEVLERNAVRWHAHRVRIAFHISLPGSSDNRVLGRQADDMLTGELAAVVRDFKASVRHSAQLMHHCDLIEDWVHMQKMLARYGLIAFIGDGAILPRRTGASQSPLEEGAVAFRAPDEMAVEVDFPNAGPMRGLGIRPGVNVLIGGGFHGKSTVLNALVRGVYPHIPGDGRERVITHPDAFFICAEEGRSIQGVDISGFIGELPARVDPTRFHTQDASGSTSEAAAIIEAVQSGAKFLLIDEDSSATNFLIRDPDMRRLIPEDPITPLFDRVQELYDRFGVSTLIVAGGSSDYLGAARHVMAMRNYRPVCMTGQVGRLNLPAPEKPTDPLTIRDRRRLLSDNFDPAYKARRLGKILAVRIKPLRLRERVLEYGNAQLDLTRLAALVDPHQVMAIGYALLLGRKALGQKPLSPSDLAASLSRRIEVEGLDTLCRRTAMPLFLSRPRCLELAGAINRLRNLKVKI